MAKKILYFDMDNVLVNFASAFPRVPESVLLEYDDHKDDIPGIFSLMDPNARRARGVCRADGSVRFLHPFDCALEQPIRVDGQAALGEEIPGAFSP